VVSQIRRRGRSHASPDQRTSAACQGVARLRSYGQLRGVRMPQPAIGVDALAFVVDLDRKISPIVTPDRPDAFESVLRARANLGAGNGRHLKGPFI
jgi:hypothetical protein